MITVFLDVTFVNASLSYCGCPQVVLASLSSFISIFCISFSVFKLLELATVLCIFFFDSYLVYPIGLPFLLLLCSFFFLFFLFFFLFIFIFLFIFDFWFSFLFFLNFDYSPFWVFSPLLASLSFVNSPGSLSFVAACCSPLASSFMIFLIFLLFVFNTD